MIGRLTRRRFAGTLLPAAMLVRGTPVFAQEDVINQTNDGQGTYWLPIVSAFYVRPEQGSPSWPEGDGPPVFPADIINPPLQFTLNPSPADSAPTIDTDWAVFQKRYGGGEQVSALAVARQFGKPRLWLHRCFDENYLAGYPELHRVYIVFEVDVFRERFPIKGQLPAPARKQLIRENVRIASGKMQVLVLNKVRLNGSGGEADENPLLTVDLTDRTLAAQAQQGTTEFIPRFATVASGDLLDQVLAVKVDIELEAGSALGLDPPEKKKLAFEIRFAVGAQYVEIGKLSGETAKK